MTDKQSYSERDICTKHITPALLSAGWNLHSQIREEVGFTAGRIHLQGKIIRYAKQKESMIDSISISYRTTTASLPILKN